MKNTNLIIIIFIQKNIYSNNLFDSTFYNIQFTSNNIEGDKIIEINGLNLKVYYLFLRIF